MQTRAAYYETNVRLLWWLSLNKAIRRVALHFIVWFCLRYVALGCEDGSFLATLLARLAAILWAKARILRYSLYVSPYSFGFVCSACLLARIIAVLRAWAQIVLL